MEQYADNALEEIKRQWDKGINPACYNGSFYAIPNPIDSITPVKTITYEIC